MICNRKGANQGKEKLNRISIRNSLILDSSMVEHSAVNRVVVGSSPTRGAVAVATKARKHQRLRVFCCPKIFGKNQKKADVKKKQAGKC